MSHFDKSVKEAANSLQGGASAPACRGKLAGYKMIHNVSIQNFRCIHEFEVPFCSKINVIVGDNGVGKTALLEAIFLALGVSSELGARFRTQRGTDAQLLANPSLIEYALFGDLFYKRDMNKNINIKINGTGRDNRNIEIKKASDPIVLSQVKGPQLTSMSSALVFEWTAADGITRQSRIFVSSDGQVQFDQTGEENENNFYFAANVNIPPTENATRFSLLSQNNKEGDFVRAFSKQFNWIKDISIEVNAGYPALYATIEGQVTKLPVVNVSGAVNRTIGVLLAMASNPKGAVFVDEFENGIYYSHHTSMWRTIMEFSRRYECQVFTTTHSLEWLNALIEAADENIDDISLWRISRDAEQPKIKQFSGKTLRMGIESGGEVR